MSAMLFKHNLSGPDLESVFAAASGRPGFFWLEDAPARRGVMGWSPAAEVVPGPGWLARAQALLQPVTEPSPLPFTSGLVGAIGYEAGRELERQPLPVGPGLLPDLILRRYEGSLHHLPDGSWAAAGAPGFVEEALEVLRSAPSPPPASPASGRLIHEGDPEGFQAGVRRILEHIRAGDCYQVNLARRLTLAGVGDPVSAFRRLRRSAPAPFGAFLSVPGGAVLSNSPELYLSVEGGRVLTRPIKGTARLGATPEEDEALVDALWRSEKERAELSMIVDLMRNDLGRICAPGTVCWGPRALTRLPTLHHAEQEVSGELAHGRSALDALAASFPPGSVTGAPKIAAMEVIRELEPCPRGLYTGAIGYLADGGGARLSVAIRIVQMLGDTAHVHVGCGVVADSDPEKELAESALKAVALLRSLCK